MPRDLTDLMERATSSAPPEPHAAADITRLAAHRQRRRTTGLAAAAAVAVVAATGLGYGVTRGHDTSPQPAGHFKHDQTVDVSSAVPASTLPGYHLEPWTVPSEQHFGSGVVIPTYQSLDASGRLVVVDAPGGDPQQGPFRVRVYDGPGSAGQSVRAPGSSSTPWLPTLYGNDRLLWRPVGGPGAPQEFHLTDLRGGHDELVPATFRVGKVDLVASPDDVTGGSMWMTAGSRPVGRSGVTVSDLYRGTFSGQVSRVGTAVSVLDVGPGLAGWVTTQGRVFVQPATGAPPRQVRVPLDPGCRVLPTSVLQGTRAFAVTRSAVAIAELCGHGSSAAQRLLAFDLSGRPLGRVTGVTPFALSFAGDALVFQANEQVLRYDLVTGSLARLSAPNSQRFLAAPQGSGSYVLWYDGNGGHVARFAH